MDHPALITFEIAIVRKHIISKEKQIVIEDAHVRHEVFLVMLFAGNVFALRRFFRSKRSRNAWVDEMERNLNFCWLESNFKRRPIFVIPAAFFIWVRPTRPNKNVFESLNASFPFWTFSIHLTINSLIELYEDRLAVGKQAIKKTWQMFEINKNNLFSFQTSRLLSRKPRVFLR